MFLPFSPTHVCWDYRTHINLVLASFVDAMCFAWLCFGMCVSSADSTGPEVPLSREEEVDLILLKNDSGVESALLYAKASSKYIKDLLAWMEKRLAMGETLRLLTMHLWPRGILHKNIILNIMRQDVIVVWPVILLFKKNHLFCFSGVTKKLFRVICAFIEAPFCK